MYIYPDNLKAKATMWLWKLKDLAIIGIIVLLSVIAFAYAGAVVSAGHCRSLCVFNHTGGGYQHYGFYPLCLCVLFNGPAAL